MDKIIDENIVLFCIDELKVIITLLMAILSFQLCVPTVKSIKRVYSVMRPYLVQCVRCRTRIPDGTQSTPL